MNLIVGLGNPEDRYKQNKHNVGFMVIDALLDELSYTSINKNNFCGQLFKYKNTLFLKPMTYMNLSGQSVRAVSDYFEPEKVVVIHDDIDLEFGTLRFKFGGGNGGHNGLKSIDSHIGRDYLRVRIGIGKPKDKNMIIPHVLSDFSLSQKEELATIIDTAKEASRALLDKDLAIVAQKYTMKTK